MIKKLLVLGAIFSMSSIFAIDEDEVLKLVDKVRQNQVDLAYTLQDESLRRYKYMNAITSATINLLQSESGSLIMNDWTILHNGIKVIDVNWLRTELRSLRIGTQINHIKIARWSLLMDDRLRRVLRRPVIVVR